MQDQIELALKEVKYPGFSRDIVSFGLVKGVTVEDGGVAVALEVTTGDESIPGTLEGAVKERLSTIAGINSVHVDIQVNKPKSKVTQAGSEKGTGEQESPLSKVKYMIAVASGKGGVGKSTFAVNLACAFSKLLGNKAVGLMDCDIYGPSTPLMIGINSRPELEGELIKPIENFGVQVMSMGFLVDEDAPVVWRGPMVMKTIQQFAHNVAWGEMEVLVVDLPPGTGDAQLSLTQTVPLDGAVIVTTPQAAAVNVAIRGARMFEKVNVPILGVAENMSYLEGENGERNCLFGEGGGTQAATGLEADLLGQVPLDPRIREGGDRGIPVVISHPEKASSKIFISIADQLLKKLGEK